MSDVWLFPPNVCELIFCNHTRQNRCWWWTRLSVNQKMCRPVTLSASTLTDLLLKCFSLSLSLWNPSVRTPDSRLWNKSIHMRLKSSEQKATHSKNPNKVQSRARCRQQNCAEVRIKCLMSHFTKSIIMIIIIKWYKSWKRAVYMLSFVVFECLFDSRSELNMIKTFKPTAVLPLPSYFNHVFLYLSINRKKLQMNNKI